MEVEETVDGAGGTRSKSKRIRLLVASNTEIRAEIVVDSLNESIVAVPLGKDITKKNKPPIHSEDGPHILKVVETPGPTRKKQRNSPIVMLHTVQPQLTQGEVAVTKVTASAAHTRHNHSPLNTSQKSLLHSTMPVRVQPKASAVYTKILMPEVQQKSSQENLSPSSKTDAPMEVKPQLSEFSEQLPSLTSSVDKATSQGSVEEEPEGTQTVMMRVNTLGDLELDPVFLTTTESFTNTDIEKRAITKTETLAMEEVRVDLQSPAATQVEVSNGNVNQSWFTSREDKEMLRWRGHAWRQGMWSREETDLLQHNIDEYCTQRGLSDPGSIIFKMSKEERSGFYRVIARGLNRPLFSIYRRVIRLYDNHNHIGKYSMEEVNKLRELHVKHGNNWQAIAAHLGRSAASVKDRCRLLNEHCNRGAWSPDEEDRLAAAVYDLAQVLPGEQVTSGISWGEVSSRVRTRSEKQCRTKWLNYLNWKRTSGVEWSKADDVQLICRLSVCGVREESQVDWTALARVWPACRSPHWLRGKWWNLKRRLPPSVQECGLREMCQHLYNQQSLSLLQSTLVELPATFLNSLTSMSSAVPTSTTLSTHSKLPECKSTTTVGSCLQDCEELAVGTIKLCIPAANFSHIINTDDSEEDFNTRLSGLVQSALLAHSVEVQNCNSPSSIVVSQSPEKQPQRHLLTTTSPLTHTLTSNPSLSDSRNSHSIVVETIEDSLPLQLSAVSQADVGRASLLGRGGLGDGVKEEDLLSDGEGGHTTTLDPSTVVTSHVFLNDPILSVSGEPLGGEEELQADPDDSRICTGLAGD